MVENVFVEEKGDDRQPEIVYIFICSQGPECFFGFQIDNTIIVMALSVAMKMLGFSLSTRN